MSKFKVGDRVSFDLKGECDSGTIVRPWDMTDAFNSKEPRWWVKWDSDGCEQHITEKFITLIKPEFTSAVSAEKCYTDLIKEAAIAALNEENYISAIRTLKLLLNEKYDQSI